MVTTRFDFLIIGADIVGLAAACEAHEPGDTANGARSGGDAIEPDEGPAVFPAEQTHQGGEAHAG